jgi:hypothetical protein
MKRSTVLQCLQLLAGYMMTAVCDSVPATQLCSLCQVFRQQRATIMFIQQKVQVHWTRFEFTR